MHAVLVRRSVNASSETTREVIFTCNLSLLSLKFHTQTNIYTDTKTHTHTHTQTETHRVTNAFTLAVPVHSNTVRQTQLDTGKMRIMETFRADK